jgi:hypothetical protein
MSQKTTKKARTEKSRTVKKAIRRTRTKERKKTTEETTTKQVIRVKDVGELVEYCKTLLGRKPFKGASIDFHPKKPAFIFIPNDNSVTKVQTEALLDFLKERNVRSVLVDALNKKKAPVLAELCDAGIEVYVLRRPGYIKRMREELLEKHNIDVPKTDKYDAVLLAFTPPKKWALVDARFLKAWKAMTEWRYADTTFRVEQQRYDANNSEGPKEDEEVRKIRMEIQAKLEEVQKLLEEVQKLEAQLFVLKVQKQYNVTEEDFQKLGIETDDTVAKAYACEAILEAMHCDTLVGFINKAGIRLSKKGRKPFIHDGRLSYVLHQLAIKVYHLDMNNQRGKIRYKKLQLAKKVWKLSKRILEDRGNGRVGEASGAGPLEREGCHSFTLALGARTPAKAGGFYAVTRPRSKAPDTRPTDNYRNHMLTHPFSPLILTSSSRLWAPHLNSYKPLFL